MRKNIIAGIAGLSILALSTPVLAQHFAMGGNGQSQEKWAAKIENRRQKMEEKLNKEMQRMRDRMEKDQEHLETQFDDQLEKFGGSFDHASTTAKFATLSVGPKGRINLRGIVESNSSTTISVRSWGGLWNVNVASTTKIISRNKNISDITVGDSIMVRGTTSTSTALTINASSLRDW